ncbi:MAG: M13 family metallopeptidase [Deltaproteobacteria bacterium]|nr:M13 family metallopeptidase [Deltaproteobacteria bacterium]
MRRIPLLSLVAFAACSSSKPVATTAPTPPPDAPASATDVTPPAPPAPAAPAKSIELGDLDRSAEPCTDFFQFANGSWRAQNPIPASMDRWSRRWKAGEDNKGRLTEILGELAKRTDFAPGSVDQQLGDFYGACMDEAAVEAAGVTPLAPVLAQIDGMKTAADVQAVIRHLHAVGVAVPFSVSANVNQHDPSKVLAEIVAGGLGLPDRDYYFKKEPRFALARAKYAAHVQKMFTLLGKKTAKADAATVIAFETRLAKATLDNVALRDPRASDHIVPFAELVKQAPHLDWAAYFDDAKLPRADLNIDQPVFMAALDKELAKTPIAVWRTYLTWHALNAASPWLSKAFADETFDFDQRYLQGVAEMKPRATRCAELIDGLLGDALGQKYVAKYFSPAAKARATTLVRNELEAMKAIVKELTWMTDATKQKALAKLGTFQVKVGYPDTWKDYGSVEIRRDTLLADIAAGRSFVVADDRAQIGKPTDRTRWGMTAPTSNAYYNPLLNEIVFPAGILQPPAFDVNASDAYNYGAIGVVIGHEISHGFDDQGAQFDATGRLENWWSPEDLKAFTARGQCVVDQFDSYFIEPGIHHNGKLVLGESIGDLGGARIAYKAFQLAHAAKPEPAPAGFTPEQEFFIAWGQFRGDEIRPETQRSMVQGDPHPIAKFRVIGPLSNLPTFASAFACPATAPMVRAADKRCEVW